MFPSAVVTGVDLAPIQPSWTAPNVKFEVDDLELDWTYPEGSFDYIHSRTIGAGIKDWNKYLRQMYTHLQPNGLIEIGGEPLPSCSLVPLPHNISLLRNPKLEI